MRPSYAAPYELGEAMYGGAAGQVVASRHPDFKEGDAVQSNLGWREYFISDGSGLSRVDANAAWTVRNSMSARADPESRTLIALDSSLSGFPKPCLRAVSVAFIMGAVFLVVQLNEYSKLDFKPQTDAYSSLFIVITAFHGAHLFVGLLMNLFTQGRAWMGQFSERRFLAVQNVGWYWHFVDAVWVFIFGFLYIAPHFT